MHTDEVELGHRRRFVLHDVIRGRREKERDVRVATAPRGVREALRIERGTYLDVAFTVDDVPVDFAQTVTYRGMMFTGIPNLVWVFGYFRASWTLRADLVSDFVCRLLAHMEKRGANRVEVALRPEDKDMEILPWIDPENFNPGYLMRSKDLLPKRGAKPEWQHTQDYWREKEELPAIDLDGSEFVYV